MPIIEKDGNIYITSSSMADKGKVYFGDVGDEATAPYIDEEDGGVFHVTPAQANNFGDGNPMTDVGDTMYGAEDGVLAKLAGNTATTRKLLVSQGDGNDAAAPFWDILKWEDENLRTYTDAGAKNAYTATLSPPVIIYPTGLQIALKIGAATNDAASTLALNGMAAKPIVTADNAALTGGELVQGNMYFLVYDGTSFRILNTEPLIMSALGDIMYGGAAGKTTRLGGNASTVKQFLTQTGDGANSAAPAWGPIADGDLPVSGVHVATKALSAANIIAMNGAPVEVLAAPGANKALIIHKAVLVITRTATAFSGGGVVKLQYDTDTTNVLADSVAAAVITGVEGVAVSSLGGAAKVAPVVNKGIMVTNDTAAFADGTGTAVLHVWYSTIATA